MPHQTDVLIIGSGLAGLTAALELSRDGERQITVLTRAAEPEDCNSSLAQGGIVGIGDGDSSPLLSDDILKAGAGLTLDRAADLLARRGPELLQSVLIDEAGVGFDRADDGSLQYGLEAAHSQRRILHVGDGTGRAIMQALLRSLSERDNVELKTSHTAVDLLTFPHHSRDPLAVYDPPDCRGAYVFDSQARRVEPIVADATVLATGGLGQIYLNTSNPPGARGDGLAMAYRAGARVVNSEYVQFHPTTLHMPGVMKILISEAVRGEGARLLTPDGERFMVRYAPDKLELATRDVVARAIYAEMLASDHPYVLLDIAGQRDADYIRGRFPWIHAACLTVNIDIARQPIPVVPAAHYACGGVLTDLHGRTTLGNLYAIGEVACTGLHGANRLASTSLLEGLVWGQQAAEHIRQAPSLPRTATGTIPEWDESDLTYEADPALIQVDLQAIRNVMWHYVGLVRNAHRLDRANRELQRLLLHIEEFYGRAYLTDDLIGLRNSVLVASVIARAAGRNPTSRGCHFREDSRPEGGATTPSKGRS
ncbi:MAG: L-aspartate oxidase [Acidobacteriota bacterium]|nr:L-aspartate oxidase [Acidobacteriota bacterium]MDH3785943.1 L-aspartate oxidase [Acidobacteriota bacterium]